MIKLIASDMDGTLLNENGVLPTDFGETFRLLKEKGILFCAASGRQYKSLLEFFSPYQNEMAFIAENGAYIVLNGEEIYENCLDKSQVEEILRICENIDDIGVILCGKKGAYLNSSDKDIQSFFKTYYSHYQMVENLLLVDDIIFKIAIYDKKGSRNNSYEQLKNFTHLKVVLSGDKALDISKLSINKGKALNILQKKLNILPKETMVFGDYLNDLEMIKDAKYSFAMKNAQSEIINSANFITEYSNNENGVIRTIKRELKL